MAGENDAKIGKGDPGDRPRTPEKGDPGDRPRTPEKGDPGDRPRSPEKGEPQISAFAQCGGDAAQAILQSASNLCGFLIVAVVSPMSGGAGRNCVGPSPRKSAISEARRKAELRDIEAKNAAEAAAQKTAAGKTAADKAAAPGVVGG